MIKVPVKDVCHKYGLSVTPEDEVTQDGEIKFDFDTIEVKINEALSPIMVESLRDFGNAGYSDFVLSKMHLITNSTETNTWIPIQYKFSGNSLKIASIIPGKWVKL